MHYLLDFVNIILHLNLYLNQWIQAFGVWIYPLLFLVVFCETGLVVTPFLPGDSLLFALGALTASVGSTLSLPVLMVVMVAAAVIGDAVNYTVGRFAGARLFANPDSKIFRRDYLERTENFFARHGGKTIILARFIPIIRTFAPFVGGMGKMKYPKFFVFNVIGGASWVLLFLAGGRFFGNQPYVQQNFHIVIFAIIVISLIPVAVEFVNTKRRKRKASSANSEI